MAGKVRAADIPADVRRRLGIGRTRAKRSMTMDAVRSAAIRVLATVADLTPAQRARVLNHAHKMNGV